MGRRRQRPSHRRRPPPSRPPRPLRPRAPPPPPRLPRRLLRAQPHRRRGLAAVRAHRRGPHPGPLGPIRRVVRRLRRAAPPGRARPRLASPPRRRPRPLRPRALRPRQQWRPRLRLLRPRQGGERGDAAGDDGGVGAVHGGAAAGRRKGIVRGGEDAGGRGRKLRRVPRDDHAAGAYHPGGHQLRPPRRRRRRAAHLRSKACWWRHVQVHPLRRCHLHEVGSDDMDERGVHGDPEQLPQCAAGRREADRLRAGGAGHDGRQHEDEGVAGERHLRHGDLPDSGKRTLRGGIPAARPRHRLHLLPCNLPRPFLCRPRVHQVINQMDS